MELNGLRNFLCDAVIRLEDGGIFAVHRVVLSAHSAYFRTLFTTQLRIQENTDVYLPGVTSETMNLILDYTYTKNVNITHENVFQLLMSADYLIVPGLLKLCCDFLRGVMATENCIGILRLVSAHFCSSFEAEARRFVMRNFVEVSQQSDEFLELPPEELQALIGSDELNVGTEEILWEGVLRWINHDKENRKCHVAELLKRVRLGLMDRKYFVERLMVHPYVTGNCESQPFITKVNNYLHDSGSITQKDGEVPITDFVRPRIPHDILFAIGGYRGDNPTNVIETYDARADRWFEVEAVDPAGPRAFHGTAVIGFNIYVIGGYNGQDYLSSCRCFNAVEKTWCEVSPMNKPRCYLSVAVLEGVVYAMGGYDGIRRQRTAERYDYQKNQWSFIAPMNVRRSDASAATLNGKIYIVGGFNGEDIMKSAEVYDPKTNKWTIIPAMNFRRSGLSCIGYHGHVYAIGGLDGRTRRSSGEKYNPTTGTWTLIPHMRNPRSKFGIEVLEDKIFAIGGFTCATTKHEVEYYDDNSNGWFGVSNMNACRKALSACIVMGLPNASEYIHKNMDRLSKNRQKVSAHGI
ncbi:Kelch-like protein 10 [Cryptotermes secundus]|uniref:Kelch-like protein diablo n=1 Tax=Cryptotermes secundus TaxID=105785 RepID=A0A2J7Q7T1_9NEOP|nr:kelch-like protein 10 [Cryptotermes secundus]PNF24644.1 Kelch-like protein 10 [Cryptotermes secundus]